jgi:hypothetical protein
VTLTLVPYAEKLISDHLREHPDLVALGARVVGKTPGDTDAAWVRVTQLGGQGGFPDHLVEFYFQFDCYAGTAGGQPEANLLARTVRAVLGEIAGVHAEGTVSGVTINGAARVLDTDFEKARERFILTATIWAHA